jgi:LysR family hydrogen peroxide-inducible transcriptional activator
MPTLTQLEYLLAVEKHRHFGKAAASCHVSQPTLSQQIHKLEAELDLVVFDRIQKPVIPTEAGRRFLEQARVVLREQERLLRFARRGGRGVSGEFRLGTIPTVATNLVPLFVGEFARAFPKVSLYIEELKTETILTELQHDRLDGALLATPLAQNGLNQRPLYYEPFLLYLSPRHPLLEKKTLTAADLDGSEMWMLQDGHCFRTQIVKFCSLPRERATVFKNIHFQSGSLDTLRNVVRRNRGYTMIPRSRSRRSAPSGPPRPRARSASSPGATIGKNPSSRRLPGPFDRACLVRSPPKKPTGYGFSRPVDRVDRCRNLGR